MASGLTGEPSGMLTFWEARRAARSLSSSPWPFPLCIRAQRLSSAAVLLAGVGLLERGVSGGVLLWLPAPHFDLLGTMLVRRIGMQAAD